MCLWMGLQGAVSPLYASNPLRFTLLCLKQGNVWVDSKRA